MKAYGITYHLRNESKMLDIVVDAKDIKSAKNKIGKKHGYKNGSSICVDDVKIIGYF